VEVAAQVTDVTVPVVLTGGVVGAASTVKSALTTCLPSTTANMMMSPGVLSAGMVMVVVKRPSAPGVAVPSVAVPRVMETGVPGVNPEPVTVT
jgi:hypothetical protein